MPVNIPSAFIQRIHTQFGNSSERFLESLSDSHFISVRFNPLKPCNTDWDEAEIVPWCKDGRYLDKKPVFTLDPLFHAGCYYPQEASSMIIDWVLRNICKLPEQPKLLDLCGAPGGKSTLLASYLNGKGLLVANEVIKNRATVLLENLTKWGTPNSVVTRNDPSDFSSIGSFFDLMLVDAPCSGEGMFRKDQRAVEEWSVDNARMCALRQQRILTDVWPALKEGGYVIYSTCTFNPAENEENLKWFAQKHGAEVLPVIVPETWGVSAIPVNSGNGLAFYPHQVKGEGFFVAVLRKTSSEKAFQLTNKYEKNRSNNVIPESLYQLLSSSHKWNIQEESNGWIAFPEGFAQELSLLKKKLNIIGYGVQLGNFIKNKLVYSHGLAMCNALNTGVFPKVNLTKQQALHFLKGEAMAPPDVCEKGYVLIAYQGACLGFAKNIGSRMNNLYPSGWRIRMAIP